MALTDKLKAIADAIRGKTGKADEMTLEQMVTEIEGIEAGGGGEEVFFDSYSGCGYTRNVVYEKTYGVANVWRSCPNLETFEAPNYPIETPFLHAENFCAYNPNLISIKMPLCKSLGHYAFRGNTNLTEVVLGSIGNPMTGTAGIYAFANCLRADLVFTIYTAETTLEGALALHGAPSSWGATNSSVIFRNSTTGEVITE